MTRLAWWDGRLLLVGPDGLELREPSGERLRVLDPREGSAVAASERVIVHGTGQIQTSEGEMGSGCNVVEQGVTVRVGGSVRRLAVSSQAPVSAVAVSPDGRLIAAAAGGSLHRWELDGRELPKIGAARETSGALMPDGGLVTVDAAGAVVAWSRRGESWVRERHIGEHEATYGEGSGCVSCDPTGRFVISSSNVEGDAVRIWRADGSGMVRLDRQSRPHRFAWIADGSLVACAGGKTATLLGPSSGRRAEIGAYPERLAFSPDGSLLAIAGNRGLAVHRVSDGSLVRALSAERHHLGLAWAGDSLIRLDMRALETWRVATGERATLMLAAGDAWASSFALSPDGRAAVVARSDREVFVIDLASGTRSMIGALPCEGSVLAFGPNGEVLALLRDTALGTRLWANRPLVGGHDGEVDALAFGPDGLLVSAGRDASLRLWSLDRPGPALAEGTHPGGALSLGVVDGRVVSIGRDGNAHLHGLDGRLLQTRALGGGVTSAEIHPSGAYALGRADGTVTVAVGGRLESFAMGSGSVCSVAFDAKAERIASAFANGTVSVREL